MRNILIPVVAHRLFGFLHPSRGTVWTRDLVAHTDAFLAPWSVSESEPAGDTEESERDVFLYVAPGTRRSVNEIRDLFDGQRRAETTGEASINAIWEQADIRFRLIAIVDHAIRTDHAILLSNVRDYARRLNQAGVLNMFFSRALNGAAGVGVETRWPFDSTKSPAYVALSDWEDTGISWQDMVWTASHEIGHLLSLRHEGDSANLMWAWIGSGGQDLRATQIMVARDYAKCYEECLRMLSVASLPFRELVENEEADPTTHLAYAGAHWRFGE